MREAFAYSVKDHDSEFEGYSADTHDIVYRECHHRGEWDHYEPDGAGDFARTKIAPPWKPSIHMPRWASRITLEIAEVRVQRLQDISEDDAIAEGCPAQPWYRVPAGPVKWFSTLWNDINGDRGSWKSNPWVWSLTFSRVTP